MRKRYAIGDYSYKVVSEVIDMVNNNCEVAGETAIPIKFYHEQLGWFVECLNIEDEPRLEKHLAFIYGLLAS
jgi:hypothetical protein